MAENSPNLGKEIDTQVQEAERVPNKMNPKGPTARRKSGILEGSTRNRVTYTGNPVRPSSDFSSAALQARRDWQDLFEEFFPLLNGLC